MPKDKRRIKKTSSLIQHIQPVQKESKLSWFRSTTAVVIGSIGTAFGLYQGYLVMLPHLSIDPTMIFDKNNPLAVTFNATNDSPFSISRLSNTCVLNFETEHHNTGNGEREMMSPVGFGNLKSKDKATIYCPPKVYNFDENDPVKRASLKVVNDYRYLTINNHAEHCFVMQRNKELVPSWLPINCE